MAASMWGSLLRKLLQVRPHLALSPAPGTPPLAWLQVDPASAAGQVRSYYVDWKMLRDVKRRKMAFDYADERLRINSLRKNTILPRGLQ
ncbi:28S ribosomal protein S14, mitochondrial-like, partial [Sorex fumeus]|uniref:28S ribosomal protein S14, mitochondrial-like n=1 Tax=Sorex fumeus TaxID=62283 RepID=UPI0024AD987C